jgi:hypothetical protein
VGGDELNLQVRPFVPGDFGYLRRYDVITFDGPVPRVLERPQMLSQPDARPGWEIDAGFLAELAAGCLFVGFARLEAAARREPEPPSCVDVGLFDGEQQGAAVRVEEDDARRRPKDRRFAGGTWCGRGQASASAAANRSRSAQVKPGRTSRPSRTPSAPTSNRASSVRTWAVCVLGKMTQMSGMPASR